MHTLHTIPFLVSHKAQRIGKASVNSFECYSPHPLQNLEIRCSKYESIYERIKMPKRERGGELSFSKNLSNL